MKEMNKKMQYNIGIIGGIIITLIFTWLMYQDRVPTGTRTIVYANSYTPVIESWSPPKRFLSAPDGAVEIVTDPVYLGVHLPRRFDSVTLRVWYKDPDSKLTRIGPRLASDRFDQWDYNLVPIEPDGEEGGWRIAKITSPLGTADFNKNIYTFIFSAPGLDKTQSRIIVKKVEFIFTREPLTWQKIERFLYIPSFIRRG